MSDLPPLRRWLPRLSPLAAAARSAPGPRRPPAPLDRARLRRMRLSGRRPRRGHPVLLQSGERRRLLRRPRRAHASRAGHRRRAGREGETPRPRPDRSHGDRPPPRRRATRGRAIQRNGVSTPPRSPWPPTPISRSSRPPAAKSRARRRDVFDTLHARGALSPRRSRGGPPASGRHRHPSSHRDRRRRTRSQGRRQPQERRHHRPPPRRRRADRRTSCALPAPPAPACSPPSPRPMWRSAIPPTGAPPSSASPARPSPTRKARSCAPPAKTSPAPIRRWTARGGPRPGRWRELWRHRAARLISVREKSSPLYSRGSSVALAST